MALAVILLLIPTALNAKTIKISPHITYKGEVIKDGDTYIPNGIGSITILHGAFSKLDTKDPTTTDYACVISGQFTDKKVSQGTINLQYKKEGISNIYNSEFKGDFQYVVDSDTLSILYTKLDKAQYSLNPMLKEREYMTIPIHMMVFSSDFPSIGCIAYDIVRPKFLSDFYGGMSNYHRTVKKFITRSLLDSYNTLGSHSLIEEETEEELAYSDDNGNTIYEGDNWGYSEKDGWVAAQILKDGQNTEYLYVQLQERGDTWIVNANNVNAYEIYKGLNFSDVLNAAKGIKPLDYEKNGVYRGTLRSTKYFNNVDKLKQVFDVSNSFNWNLKSVKDWDELYDYLISLKEKLRTDSDGDGDFMYYVFKQTLGRPIAKRDILKEYVYDNGITKDGTRYIIGSTEEEIDAQIEKDKDYYINVYLANETDKQEFFNVHGYPKSLAAYGKVYGDKDTRKYYESGSAGAFIGMKERMWLDFNQLQDVFSSKVYDREPSSSYTNALGTWHVYYWNHNGRGYTLYFNNGELKDIISHNFKWEDEIDT